MLLDLVEIRNSRRGLWAGCGGRGWSASQEEKPAWLHVNDTLLQGTSQSLASTGM